MPHLNTIPKPAEVQELLERISELEEQVSNLKRLEVTLERNAALFNSLLSASREGIAMTRADATIIRVIRPVIFANSTTRHRHSCRFCVIAVADHTGHTVIQNDNSPNEERVTNCYH